MWSALAPRSVYPHGELDEIWKLLLLHQFHDIIPGSGIHWVYEDTARDHAQIRSQSARLIDDALALHVGAIDTSGSAHPVVVFNSLSHERRELVARRRTRRRHCRRGQLRGRWPSPAPGGRAGSLRSLGATLRLPGLPPGHRPSRRQPAA